MTYRVVRRLGRGGMGVVDLAVTPDGTEVALKRLSLHGTPDEVERARARIRREAEVLAALDHPAVVPLLDVVDDGDDVVLVMPYLAGGSLHDRVASSGPLPAEEVREIADALLDALAAAHRQGIVHRDIKPENVLFDGDGRPLLVDFGVARATDHTPGLTATSMVVGTPAFMAPEQARGEPAGPASDVFSLGATLLHALTGEGPYGPGSTDPRVLMHRAALGRVERLPRDLPPDLRTLLTTSLDRNAARRPSAARLQGGVAGTSPLTGLVGAVRRHRLVVGVVAAVALLVVAGGTALVVVTGGDDSAAATTRPTTSTTTTPPTTTTEPCEPLPYRACGPDGLEPAAPNTDGTRCTDDHEDYDGDAENGCEAAPDGLEARTTLGDGDSIEATIVPLGDVDTFVLPVEDGRDVLCDGELRVVVRAPVGIVLRLEVRRGDSLLGEAVAEAGDPAEVRVGERCGFDDSGELVATVRPVGEARTGATYQISRDGDL